jgi:threonine/homoserine/homoserine lactone efflux protein
MACSPGPGNLFFAANAARFGPRATIGANAGYHLATWGVTCAIGLGFSQALQITPAVTTAVRVIGSAYVFWLAIGLLRAGVAGPGRDVGLHVPGFADGVTLLLLNPKAYVIIALIFSQFLTGGAPKLVEVMAITTLFTLNNLLAFTLYTLAGDRLAQSFRSANSARRLNLVFGLMLALVALWMLILR